MRTPDGYAAYYNPHHVEKFLAHQRFREDLADAQTIAQWTRGSQAGPELTRGRQQWRTRVSLLNAAHVVDAALLGHVEADDDQIAGPIDPWIAAIPDPDPITRISQPLFDKSAGLMIFLVDDNVPGVPHARILSRPGRAAMSGHSRRISIETIAKWDGTPRAIRYCQW